jgi:5,10-methylenetetrahydrofolate reductase
VDSSLIEKIAARQAGICLYGMAPPKASTPADELSGIVARQLQRLGTLKLDGLVVYDIQDEGERIAAPRPFPFLPTLDPETYAHSHLADLTVPKVVYRCVNRDTPETFVRWLDEVNRSSGPRLAVLVGAPSQSARIGLTLTDAYAAAREHARDLVLGGIAIAERHSRRQDEHTRILAKTAEGCRFFVTQAVYDVTATKSLLSDYAMVLRERGEAPVPIILTFSPCGSEKTLAFMKWLGIHFPRWLENDLRLAPDPLASSLALCESIFAEVWDYARDHGVPVGINVESVSIRKAEIEASLELMRRLQHRMEAQVWPSGGAL